MANPNSTPNSTPNSAAPRPVVAESWERCLARGLARESIAPAPIRMPRREVAAYRDAHPLASAPPLCSDLLGEAMREAGCVYGLADARGVLLWVDGQASARRAAERTRFVEGADWSEPAAGTNAVGTSLEVGEPVAILGADHFNPSLRSFASCAAPIRDPEAGDVTGVLAVTGGAAACSAPMAALVRATARVIESELARRFGVGDGSLRVIRNRVRPAPVRQAAPMRLSVLGRARALLEVDGRLHQLTPRHSEIVALLCLAPGGLTAEALAERLPPGDLSPTSVRVEISRLRRQIGDDLLSARPYALCRPVRSDMDQVADLLAHGRVAEAFDAYAGSPLPASVAPEILARGEQLRASLRQGVLTSYNIRLLRRWLTTPDGAADADAWATYAGLLPVGSPGRDQAAARAAELGG